MKVPGFICDPYEGQEYTAHLIARSKVTTRCTGPLCVTKERALFKSIVDRDISMRKETLRTVFLIARVFPMRTRWDKEGNEMRFCEDCKISVKPDHGYKLKGQDYVKCHPLGNTDYAWESIGIS